MAMGDEMSEQLPYVEEAPTLTDPIQALQFLSGRFKFAGVGHAVALSYARDIDYILAQHTEVQPAEPMARHWREAIDNFAGSDATEVIEQRARELAGKK